jgi:NADH-quinone oxidoreductase subunit J
VNVELVLFGAFALLTLLSAGLVIFAKSPISSAMSLVATFFFLAGIYVLLWAHTVAVLQVLVYAGAIMVLFLFVIMLLNLGNDFEDDIRGTAWQVLAGGSALVIVALLARVFAGDFAPPLGNAAGPQALATATAERGTVGLIGVPLYQDFMVPLQATAILLLIAVVGAVVLAKRKV